MSDFDEEKKFEQDNQQSEQQNTQQSEPTAETNETQQANEPASQVNEPSSEPTAQDTNQQSAWQYNQTQPAEEANTTYHYSYTSAGQNSSQQANSGNQQTGANASGQYSQAGYQYSQTGGANTYYQPPKTEQNYYSAPQGSSYNTGANYTQTQTPTEQNDDGEKPPKKNKTGKVIVIVLIVCVVVALVGIIAAAVQSNSGTSSSESTTQSENVESNVETQDSNEVATQDSEGNLTVAGVAAKVMDSCVGITVYSQQQDAYSYFYGYGSDDSSSEETESGEGSGIIMSENNGKTYILTCAHVISDGDSFTVTLNDKTEYEATMVAYDSQTDIGVLSIEATGLQVAEFASSDNLVVGEQVVAIGCPGGIEFMNSVTSGYISALDRPISSSIGYDNNCIQTDAAINPGNSGGALFNMQGQVIGVNSSKIASTEYEGMGFAVPSDTAISTANSLINSGYVEGRAKIGITYTPLSSYSNASSIISALEEQGYEDAEGTMVINSVDGSSDLASKDIQQYDMIVAINGETMTSTDVLTSILSDSSPGDTITLTIARIENNQISISEVECKLMESTGDDSE